MSKVRKLDIFPLLRAVERRDFDWLSKQPEDARNEFAPLVAMRWATGAPDEIAGYLIWLINRRVNRHLFALSQHPDLCYRLLASCGMHQSYRYKYLKGPPHPINDNKALRLLAELHPLANRDELRLLVSQASRAEFKQLVVDCGVQDDKEYMSAYDKLTR